jgi:AI-2 transport protein TqsA
MKQPSLVKPLLILTGAVIVLAGMYFTASILTPILFAIFIATLLTPINHWFKRRMSSPLALLLSIGVLVLVALFLVLLVGNSFTTLVSTLTSYQDDFSQRRAELEAMAGDMGQTSVFQALLSALDPATLVNAMTFILEIAGSLFKNSLLILFVTVFALAEGPQFLSRMFTTFGADHFLPGTVINLYGLTISYFGLRAIVNLIVAVVTALMLWLFGIPYAGLWGVLIFFLSFIPYLGAFLSTIPPVILAYAQGGLGLALVIILLTIVINSLSENIVAPLVMGKGLSVSPTVVFLSFIFWMFILGGLGAFIAMPLTLALILFMRNFEETRGLAEMMVTFPETMADTTGQPSIASG